MHGFDYNTDLHLSDIRKSLDSIPRETLLIIGTASALQSFTLGAGYATKVPHWSRSFPLPTRHTSHTLLNAAGVNVWRPDGPTEGKCLWEWHGVWGWDKRKNEAIVLRENYFVKDPSTGRKVTIHCTSVLT